MSRASVVAPCQYCGRQVAWLLLRGTSRKLKFEPREYPVMEVAESERYGLTRSRDVIDLFGDRHPPEKCLIKHFCKEEYEARLDEGLYGKAEVLTGAGPGR